LQLVAEHTERRPLYVLGDDAVNVLELNAALDAGLDAALDAGLDTAGST
jgi:hypothetical protein